MRRPLPLLIASALTAALLGAAPARADTGPTTLAVEGTLKVVVVDHFGEGSEHHDHDARSERLYTVVTDAGAEIPVDVDEDAPANGRFRGELVVTGAVAAALDEDGLLPRGGSTIAEDTRAGRAAIAVAEDQTAPLTVESSTVAAAVTAAAVTPIAHRAYVARMTGVGSVDGTDAVVKTAVDGMLQYWRDEPGAISSFTRPGSNPLPEFAAPAGVTLANGCGMVDPDNEDYIGQIWNAAAAMFPIGTFNVAGNHLIVLAGEECGNAGPVGIANIGSSINDGGGSLLTFDPDTFDQTGAHELGHNFGLEHANLHSSSHPNARFNAYLDLYSPMGLSVGSGLALAPPALGTLYRSQLGLIGPGEAAGVALAAGQPSLQQSFSLAPRDGTGGLRSILVTDPYTGTTYSIDFRAASGRDAEAFYSYDNARLNSPYSPVYDIGVVIERQSSTRETFLMSQTAADPDQGSFWINEVFAPSGGLRVTVGSLAATSAAVTVQLAAPPAALRTFRTKTPKIRGTARVGKTLKVTVGSWSPRPSYRYQWYANGKKITKKGTKSSFKLTSKQKGKRVTVKVTGRKSGYTTVTKTSGRTKKVVRRR
ncbi:MAG: zinc-dependent metalloprotease family protein [Aeromicrobium sp.]